MAWTMEEAILYYKKQGAPADQSALISLLREVQSECGGSLPVYAVGQIAGAYGVKESFLQAVIRRIPGLRIADTHCLELCAGPNCGKHAALASLAEELQKTAACRFSVRYVPCMRLCGKGPNIKWDGKLYNGADEALLRQLTAKHTP